MYSCVRVFVSAVAEIATEENQLQAETVTLAHLFCAIGMAAKSNNNNNNNKDMQL